MRAELGKVLAQKHLAAKKMADESNRHEAIDANLQAAVAAGRDDLAEAGIAEQMDIEARLPVLENTIADCAAQEKELEGFIAALQAKKTRDAAAVARLAHRTAKRWRRQSGRRQRPQPHRP